MPQVPNDLLNDVPDMVLRKLGKTEREMLENALALAYLRGETNATFDARMGLDVMRSISNDLDLPVEFFFAATGGNA
jgi:hypothetical protein